jgi:hypothetical protein
MAKLKEFKGYKVPEGMTHYAEANDEYEEGFYKNNGTSWLYCSPNSNFLIKPFELPPNAIELPEEEPEEEPKQRVKTFKGHKVPEGATHYADVNSDCWESFLKEVDGKWMFTYVDSQSSEFSPCARLPDHMIKIPLDDEDWLKVDGKVVTPNGVTSVLKITVDHGVFTKLGNYSRSELKEYIEPEGLEPEIGSECLGRKFGKSELEECKIVYIDGPNVLALFKNRRDEYCEPDWCEEVEPLQTEEEKAKEAFIEAGIISYLDCEDANVNDHDLELLLGQMFEDGFKAPEDK